MKTIQTFLIATTALFCFACGAALSDGSAAIGYEDYEDSTSFPGQDAAASIDLPPEQEIDLDLKAPQASLNYVYVAATARDSVVRIDAETLDIRIIPVGGRPTTVAALPDSDAVVVINSGTRDLSIIRSSPQEDVVKTVDILPYANAVRVSPDGRFALVYYSEKLAEPDDPVGDFQTLAVVTLEEGKEKTYLVSTGFHITDIFFHDSKELAYLVTDDGVGVLDLSALKEGLITPLVAISEDAAEDPKYREVLITPDGTYAIVRYASDPHLRVVELETGEMSLLELDSGATDVDLVPGSNRVLLVLRSSQLAVVVSLAKLFTDPDNASVKVDLPGFMPGTAQVSPDGKRAVLYTTVVAEVPGDVVRSVGILELDQTPPTYKVLPVQKPIVAAAISPKSGSALLFHSAEADLLPNNPSEVEETLAKAEGVTVLDLQTGYRKFVQTNHRWYQHLFVSTGTKDQQVFLLTPDPDNYDHQMVALSLGTYLTQVIHLISTPSSMVYVPTSNKVAVSQEHPSGRISFVDGDDGSVFSVTGYEIAGFIH